MALKWLEGFESYGVTNTNTVTGLAKKYTTSQTDSNFTIQAGRIAGHGVQFSASATIQPPVFTARSTWTVGFAYKQDVISSNSQILRFQDSTSIQIELELSKDGEFQVYRGASEVTIIARSTGAKIRPGIWNYIEIKHFCDDSTGTVELRVNGIAVLTFTGDTKQTGNATDDRIVFLGSSNGSSKSYYDDIYICDNQGSNNTTFLGSQKVTMILPTGDHGTNQWTPNSGANHYDRVNENPHDSSTTYLSDSTSGDTEEFDYANTGSEISSIKGIQVNTVFETDSASAFSVKNHINSGGASSDDAGTAGTNGTYTTAGFVAETDPNTSALWTKTNLDAALFGVKTV